MNQLQNQLKTAFATNFLLYYHSHVAHVNTTGRNFVSDHKLLGGIYEDAQGAIDQYAEYLRILHCDMPLTLQETLDSSEIMDVASRNRDTAYLYHVYDLIETTIDTLELLYDCAEGEREVGLSNWVAERINTHKKQCWKLRSVLQLEEKDDYEE